MVAAKDGSFYGETSLSFSTVDESNNGYTYRATVVKPL
jgi:hypothetical protein